jgi:quinol monooxygenase YgiN
MFGILFKAQVKPEKCQAFIDFINLDIQFAKESEPGTLQFDLYKYKAPKEETPEEENTFFVYEAYRDKKAFEEHQQNEPYRRWKCEIEPIIEKEDLFEVIPFVRWRITRRLK